MRLTILYDLKVQAHGHKAKTSQFQSRHHPIKGSHGHRMQRRFLLITGTGKVKASQVAFCDIPFLTLEQYSVYIVERTSHYMIRQFDKINFSKCLLALKRAVFAFGCFLVFVFFFFFFVFFGLFLVCFALVIVLL